MMAMLEPRSRGVSAPWDQAAEAAAKGYAAKAAFAASSEQTCEHIFWSLRRQALPSSGSETLRRGFSRQPPLPAIMYRRRQLCCESAPLRDSTATT